MVSGWTNEVLLVVLTTPFLVYAEQPKVLTLVADTYCPYNCTAGAKSEGILVDLTRAVFEAKGYEIRYKVVPWTRALKMVKEGQADIALGSPPEEAVPHGLIKGSQPIGYGIDCVYVRADNPLKYNNRADDLNSLKKVGTVADFQYYEQMAEWLQRPENKSKNFIARGETASETNLIHLSLGRLDGLMETSAVIDYLIMQKKLEGKVRIAGCHKPQAVFNLISPQRKDARQLAAELDSGILALEKDGKVQPILERYGVHQWKIINKAQ